MPGALPMNPYESPLAVRLLLQIPEALPTNLRGSPYVRIPKALPINHARGPPYESLRIPQAREALPTQIPEALPTNISEALPTKSPRRLSLQSPQLSLRIPEALPTNP